MDPICWEPSDALKIKANNRILLRDHRQKEQIDLRSEWWLYFTQKHPSVGRSISGLPSRHTCSRPSSDWPAESWEGWCPPEPVSTWRTHLILGLREQNILNNCDNLCRWTANAPPTFLHRVWFWSAQLILVIHLQSIILLWSRGPQFILM